MKNEKPKDGRQKTKPAGYESFEDLISRLFQVPKAELEAEVKKDARQRKRRRQKKG